MSILPRITHLAVLAVIVLIGGAQAPGPSDPAAREFTECPDCPVMVGIPAGRFLMGSPAQEAGRFDTEGPQHAVSVRAFALGKYPVTSGQFTAFLRATGYQPRPCNDLLGLGWRIPGRGLVQTPADVEPPNWPAVCLDWKDAEAYVAWLNAKARAARPQIAAGSGPYRLPTEAEWEYAARAGTTTARWWGEAIGSGHANCNGCGSQWDNKLLARVQSFPANPFGVSGMLGNAWEWTADCWHPSYVGAPADGRAWTDSFCTKRAIRGGAWNNVPVFIRSAARAGASGNGTGDYDYSTLTGFRVARDLP